MKYLAILILSLIGVASRVSALSADTVVSIVNFYPGSDIYELEGHTVLRIAMPGNDIAVSYGVFDFNSPNFVYRFVKGETDYMAVAYPWAYVAEQYAREGRRTVEHRLDIDSAAKRRLIDMLQENLKPENRTYRYNYVKDNCVTRPLRMVELAVGDSILLTPSPFEGTNPTFRSIMRHYHDNYPWYQFGIDLALGSGIDHPIDIREQAFAPVVFDAQIAGATAGGRSLVRESIVTFDSDPAGAVEGPTPWYATPMAVFWALFIFVLGVSIRDVHRGRLTRCLTSVFYACLGIAGLVLTFLIFVSVHEATSPNWLYLGINPFCLVPAVCVWINRAKNLVKWYQFANFALLLALPVAMTLGEQSANRAMLPLYLSDLVLSASCLIVFCKKD